MVENSENRIMTDIPVFSIIVPVYNKEKFLHKCIDSLLTQRYTNFELVLVDDGSTDHSGKICDEYAREDSRVKVFHTCNQGVSTARNLGISVACGNYINFVDSDDWVAPDYLEKYVEARIEYDYDLVYAEMIRVSDNGSQEIISLKEFSIRSEGNLSGAFVFLLECREFGFTCNKSFKREIITSNEISFRKEFRLFEDAIFTSAYCLHINSIRLISSAVYFYRSVENSLLRTEINHETYHLIFCKGSQALEALANKQQSDSLNRAIEEFCQRWEQWAILHMYLSGKNVPKEARLNYLRKYRYRFLLPRLRMSKAEGILNVAILGMYLKKDTILDVYFSLFSFVYKLKQRYLGKLTYKK